MEIDIETVKAFLYKEYPDFGIVEIPIENIVFEERVKQKCFHCKHYNSKWTCPPRLPNVDYPKMFKEYSHAAVVICEESLNGNDLEEKRQKSTNMVHRALLHLEKQFYDNNHPMAISFIGGSCKLCKNGCNPSKCANPYISRIPWEATGCNVIASLSTVGINVTFPITNSLHRYGLILW